MVTDIRHTIAEHESNNGTESVVDRVDEQYDEEYLDSDSYSDDDADIETDDILGYTEDWGENGADFTKQYNRMRQHIQGQANGAPKASLTSNKTTLANGNSAAIVKDGTSLKSVDLSKYSSRIKLDEFNSISDIKVGSSGVGGGRKSSGISTAPRKDKADRATTEQVLDPRTRIILFKLLNQGVIYEINGCISTGKEANVYHAVTETGEHRAIKIYKTSILVFKDRDRYVSGEYRFRHGYSRHNPRKMVRLWAEKEMRNLKRLYTSGIPSPNPLILRQHVLVMDFLGSSDGVAYPRLKDATISASRFPKLYYQLVKDMRVLYNTCHLVHADLSEYNILYHSKTLYIIDVSQSVEHDHPYALDFLRHDCNNVNEFFRKRGNVRTMSLRRLFEFITDPTIGTAEADVERALEDIKAEMEEISDAALSKMREDDEVFRQSYIPRTLNEVVDYERDVQKVNDGKSNELIYNKLVGLKLSGANLPEKSRELATLKEENEDRPIKPVELPIPETRNSDNAAISAVTNAASNDPEDDDNFSDEDEDISDSDGQDDDDDEDEHDGAHSKGKKHESKEAKRERKQAVKDAKREKRKTKMPKAVKKRKERGTSGRKSK
ncbi:Serine/threonine-protein kinase rio1 [Coemansia sp. RSA 1813]|nr:Serine/threonine-protein kinase rio1 [Coemansia sp. RSA 1646]KAJ1769943.1 Serine/threonine-protein kinase rio1 [Coemansia sp. RSA 1843]KAJ2087854.1 Serine/threonine-protein kinase rio1 [Coemansia sp. RSA 986]KAJ2212746.1 Serine/threonine-protein kinase rio1 [Coemansia sp. RSA 487]KAJ2567485.1 Serine/threonine-protein kinase rio1 [Coemansia sp. RSA 1813]